MFIFTNVEAPAATRDCGYTYIYISIHKCNICTYMYVCMYFRFYIQVHLCGCGDPFRWDSTCSFRDSRIYKVRGSVIFTCMEYANVHLRACGDPLAGTASVEFVTPPYTELPTVSYINILNMQVFIFVDI